jgi:hypothetical protein
MSVGIRNSPNGIAKNRNASGNASTRNAAVPSRAKTAKGTIAIIANCATLLTRNRDAMNHTAPATTIPPRAGSQGRGTIASVTARFRHSRYNTIGTTRNPWAKVSERSQISIIDQVVGAKATSTHASTSTTTQVGVSRDTDLRRSIRCWTGRSSCMEKFDMFYVPAHSIGSRLSAESPSTSDANGSRFADQE